MSLNEFKVLAQTTRSPDVRYQLSVAKDAEGIQTLKEIVNEGVRLLRSRIQNQSSFYKRFIPSG